MENTKNTLWPVAVSSIYLVIYVLLLFSESGFGIAFLMLLFSPFLIIWMVLYILKYGKPSSRTFEEAFYDDVDDPS